MLRHRHVEPLCRATQAIPILAGRVSSRCETPVVIALTWWASIRQDGSIVRAVVRTRYHVEPGTGRSAPMAAPNIRGYRAAGHQLLLVDTLQPDHPTTRSQVLRSSRCYWATGTSRYWMSGCAAGCHAARIIADADPPVWHGINLLVCGGVLLQRTVRTRSRNLSDPAQRCWRSGASAPARPRRPAGLALGAVTLRFDLQWLRRRGGTHDTINEISARGGGAAIPHTQQPVVETPNWTSLFTGSPAGLRPHDPGRHRPCRSPS